MIERFHNPFEIFAIITTIVTLGIVLYWETK